MKIGIIGCGVISDIYMKNLTGRFHTHELVACADLFLDKAKERAEAYNIKAMTVEEMLDDPSIGLVINLTNPQFHKEVSLNILAHGKHVYSEKPLATTVEDGMEILAFAKERGLQVGCAPDTFLGAGLQTVYRALADGWIGQPVAATGFFTCRGHERWHGNPGFYYQPGAGPHFDMGPYYLTALVGAFGSVKRVNAMSKRTFDTRLVTAESPLQGTTIPVNVDTHISASLEFENGVIATLMLSFDIWAANLPLLEIYGTTGSLSVPDPNFFDGPAKLHSMHGEDWKELPLVNPFHENSRGIGPAQMCTAIENGEEVTASGERALHVLEIIAAIEQAGQTGESITLKTCCEKPALLPVGMLAPEYSFT